MDIRSSTRVLVQNGDSAQQVSRRAPEHAFCHPTDRGISSIELSLNYQSIEGGVRQQYRRWCIHEARASHAQKVMFTFAVIAAVIGTTEMAIELLNHFDQKRVGARTRSL